MRLCIDYRALNSRYWIDCGRQNNTGYSNTWLCLSG
ncbi:unnamed protein product [Tuber melanosporum]|uniref:(Perigord truffle) hypothetical protein n=1 Tax=Tuber melanosporum (strain Mel28) TaxID=656061 RepID=D5G8I8_TUBMM|nr:uncharacterized protein GSTUM_00002893001 [Tuber melanosporum]CAZ80835.1 unnamed protein product [Tuber melanosporum]